MDEPSEQPYTIEPIGVVHSPYETPADAPHQGFADDADAELEIFEAYADGLDGIDDILRVTVVYWAHLAERTVARDGDRDGAFARRGPTRPNPLNICTGTILGVDGRRVRVSGLDAVDGSPLVDLKPALQAER